MENLVFLKNQEALTDSLTVAEKFSKRHKDVMRAIDNKIKNDSTQKCAQCFRKTRYKDPSGKWNDKYLINEKGFQFLIMGFTGKEADKWKWKYIDAFDRMRTVIQEKTTLAWNETRQFGKLTRQAECDTLKRLVDYAKSQGSQHAEKLYTVYTKLANTSSGITNRDEATIKQLTTLDLTENIILHVIDMGIIGQKHYKEIYQDCKSQIEKFKTVAFIEANHG